MKYRRLGKTDLKVSVIGIGTFQYGGEWGKAFTQEDVNSIFNRGRELGFNLIDTAECYGDHLAEVLTGNAVKGCRQEWVIATKFGHKFNGFQKRDRVFDVKSVQQQLEGSLKALQTDYIDLYQIHSPKDDEFNNDELWTMLDKQVKAGKVRHLGISILGNDNPYQTDSATKLGAQTIQIIYNRLEQNAAEKVFPSCIRQDLGVLARVPLASGFLSGKYKPGMSFPQNDLRSQRDQQKAYEDLKLVEKIGAEEVPKGMDMAQWAIAWSLKHEAVSCCIPGFKDNKQLESAAGAADLDMVSVTHPQAWK